MKLKKRETLYSFDNLIGYVRYSGGAIELHENYVVFYKNFLPFSWNVYGRVSIIINLNDIDLVEHRGCGWFPGHFSFSFKHFKRPITFVFFKWWVWRRKKLNKSIEPLYQFIADKVRIGWQMESYRKIQTVNEIKELGKCPKCGAEVDESLSFCGHCGEKIK